MIKNMLISLPRVYSLIGKTAVSKTAVPGSSPGGPANIKKRPGGRFKLTSFTNTLMNPYLIQRRNTH